MPKTPSAHPFRVAIRGKPDPKAIGTACRRLREAEGIGVTDMAERVGMAYQNLSRLEKGGRLPTLATLSRFFQTLGYELVLEARPKGGKKRSG